MSTWAVGCYIALDCRDTHKVAGRHKLESTEEFVWLAIVRDTSEPRTDPSRCLTNMLQVNNIWTPLVTWRSSRCPFVVARLLEKRPADISDKTEPQLPPGKRWWLNKFPCNQITSVFPNKSVTTLYYFLSDFPMHFCFNLNLTATESIIMTSW